MKKTLLLASTLAATFAFSSASFAVEASKWATEAPAKADRHTPQGLYITAENTYKWMKEDDSVILVDVRTPAEWQFVGYTPMAQIMIPSVLFKYNAVDDKKPRYKSVINDKFISEFEEKLFDLGADKNTPFVVMCRSGATRAQPAAKMLDQYGYKNVYIMTDGFEGGKVKKGEHKQWRMKAGWKVNNPVDTWTYKIDTKNAYLEK
ncbi:rhodanese-like domain-containing protein [Thiomicrorhabdus sp. 6S3-12]|uniref:rhodanese-like domain-containing protein n=1 Tax=Thiomicrorhabdus sp. 6S3-12 TaxID=2819681 RepID=UPI001AAC49DB|nr:rhodanese-like domain-containing protein [Thiomicrorhabdus sp. 6S3-12]MBO1924866.1 sulfurtransferase [Thiomicrorhabdus sp. 6S3-12]